MTDPSVFDDVDTEVQDRPPFWSGADLDDGQEAKVKLQEDLHPAEESQYADLEALAMVNDPDEEGWVERLYAPSSKTQLADLEDLLPGEGDVIVVSVEGTGTDRFYTVEEA